jgi:hypothetical protein
LRFHAGLVTGEGSMIALIELVRLLANENDQDTSANS